MIVIILCPNVVMLRVAWITLDDAEWMIYNFLH